MTARRPLQAVHGADVARLVAALEADDRAAFDTALEDLFEGRNMSVTQELRVITDTLQSAMARFREEYRITELAEREVPDARLRLSHVLTMTNDAAHRTIEQIEHCNAIAQRTAAGARELAGTLSGPGRPTPSGLAAALTSYLERTGEDCEALRRHLGEALMAQSYQDLTGQIIGRVITLVRDVEGILGELLRVSGDDAATGAPTAATEDLARGVGPAVPGVTSGAVASQDDVDALLADLDL